ncbi:MAG TPA: AI-2E family transporter [Rhodocyclaceae bacterium]|nr:AI-2E family transporter [Rhodocyclaceae bacterium]
MSLLSSRTRISRIVLIGLSVLLFAIAALIGLPFIAPLTWALMLAVLAQPVDRWIAQRIRLPSLAAALSVIAVIIVLALPTVFVLTEITAQGAQTLHALNAGQTMEQWRGAIEQNPRLAPILLWVEQHVDIAGQFENIARNGMRMASSFMLGSAYAIVGWLITFYMLFFFLRDKKMLLEAVADWLPLSPPETNRLFNRVRDTLYAVTFGSLAISAAQGTLVGLVFWFLGLPSPLMWGGIMAVFALIPVVGASSVWIVTSAYFALQGEWQKMFIVIACGASAIALVDNVLYPTLVKGRLDLHPVPIFIAVVGGVSVFGATGVVLGPLVLSLILAVRDIWLARLSES